MGNNTPDTGEELSEDEFSEQMGLTEQHAPVVTLLDDTGDKIRELADLPGNVEKAKDIDAWISRVGETTGFSGKIITTEDNGEKKSSTSEINNREGDIKAIRRLQLILQLVEKGQTALAELKANSDHLGAIILQLETDNKAENNPSYRRQKEEQRDIAKQIRAIKKVTRGLPAQLPMLSTQIRDLANTEDYVRDFVKIDEKIDTLGATILQINISRPEDIEDLLDRFDLGGQDADIATKVQTNLKTAEDNLRNTATKKGHASPEYKALRAELKKGYTLAAKIMTKLITNKEKDQTFYNSILKHDMPKLDVQSLGIGEEDLTGASEALTATGDFTETKIEGQEEREDAEIGSAEEVGDALDDFFDAA